MSTALLYCDAPDPKKDNATLRDYYRRAMLVRKVSVKVAEIVGNGEYLGHKALICDAALEIVEEHLGDDIEPFKEKITRYERGGKLRSVVRERLELDRKWRPTGYRLTNKSAATPEQQPGTPS